MKRFFDLNNGDNDNQGEQESFAAIADNRHLLDSASGKTGQKRHRSANANAIAMTARIQSIITLALTSAIFQQHITRIFPTCDAWAGPATLKFASSTTSTAWDPFFLSAATAPSRQTAPTAKLDLKMQDRCSIRMLLDHSRFPSTLLTTTNQLKSRPSVEEDTQQQQQQQQTPKQKYRILGFDVFPCQVGRSNVNLETWNNNGNSGDIGYRAMNARFAWNTTSPLLDEKPLQIPTKAEIMALKLTELKDACAKRGLVKTGDKVDLQDRLLDWTIQQRQQRRKPHHDFISEWFDDEEEDEEDDEQFMDEKQVKEEKIETKSPNSLEEWSRTVDLESLRKKRREIHRLKRQGSIPPAKKKQQEERKKRRQKTADASSCKEYLQKLQKTLEAPSSQYSSNVQAKEIYMASKNADQAGDRDTSIALLQTLLTVTPNDGRVYRRLARMYNEQGQTVKARSVLQAGLQKQPENPWLWHGVAQLLDTQGSEDAKTRTRRSYQKAIQLDPTFAHSYHALGTFEHTEGNIAEAMKILKQGVKYCPSNHRLHHALGDIYRGARLLNDAERSYHRSLEHGSPINYCFAYSALAAVAFEKDEINNARKWLRKSILLNNGRHAQGWVSLAQLEESQGNIDVARAICIQAVTQYEAELIESGKRYRQKYQRESMRMKESGASKLPRSIMSFDSDEEVMDFDSLMQQTVPKYRSGDRFLRVFRNWARFEQKHGTADNVDAVYARASAAFPLAMELTLNWAKYHASNGNYEQARSLYTEACKMGHRSQIKAYRALAEFEISMGDSERASMILYQGAEAAARSDDGGLSSWKDLAKLYLLWATCEWRNNNLPRAEVLFDYALRQTNNGDEGGQLRSFILYSMARFEFSRGKYLLAQHCIGVCMKENAMPLGKSRVWELWANVASAMHNSRLRDQCLQHAEVSMKREHDEHPLLSPANSGTGEVRLGSERNLFRREPWQIELFGFESAKNAKSDFYTRVEFPSLVRSFVESEYEIEESFHY